MMAFLLVSGKEKDATKPGGNLGKDGTFPSFKKLGYVPSVPAFLPRRPIGLSGGWPR